MQGGARRGNQRAGLKTEFFDDDDDDGRGRFLYLTGTDPSGKVSQSLGFHLLELIVSSTKLE